MNSLKLIADITQRNDKYVIIGKEVSPPFDNGKERMFEGLSIYCTKVPIRSTCIKTITID
jgi:hypothetical protein